MVKAMSLQQHEELRLRVLEYISYLASSAKNLVHEPKAYGSFRLVDAISRFVILYKEIMGGEDEFLIKLRQFIDANKDLVMYDQEKFYRFLDELVDRILEEVENEVLRREAQ